MHGWQGGVETLKTDSVFQNVARRGHRGRSERSARPLICALRGRHLFYDAPLEALGENKTEKEKGGMRAITGTSN